MKNSRCGDLQGKRITRVARISREEKLVVIYPAVVSQQPFCTFCRDLLAISEQAYPEKKSYNLYVLVRRISEHTHERAVYLFMVISALASAV